ncbi:hypothetical protein LP422_22610 [Janibacter limosus]|uniref:hypothetical protein n=1 Tax=Janibacter limosus TaxID=53458 RepID=UPI0035DE0D9B|nr:hypothetical protein LP422_22610 [Janibacter limosus]
MPLEGIRLDDDPQPLVREVHDPDLAVVVADAHLRPDVRVGDVRDDPAQYRLEGVRRLWIGEPDQSLDLAAVQRGRAGSREEELVPVHRALAQRRVEHRDGLVRRKEAGAVERRPHARRHPAVLAIAR